MNSLDYETRNIQNTSFFNRQIAEPASFLEPFTENNNFTFKWPKIFKHILEGRLSPLFDITRHYKINIVPTASNEFHANLIEMNISRSINSQSVISASKGNLMGQSVVEECPICLYNYYIPINRTKCCLQPICTNCFLQLNPPIIGTRNHLANIEMHSFSEQLLSARELRGSQSRIITVINHDPTKLKTKCPYCANKKNFL